MARFRLSSLSKAAWTLAALIFFALGMFGLLNLNTCTCPSTNAYLRPSFPHLIPQSNSHSIVN
jgi:hypothetical protein